MKYTRMDYLKKNVTHDQYYGQFVTDAVIKTLLSCINVDRIKSSTDKHFNDIPMNEWDKLSPMIGMLVGKKIEKANIKGGISLSDLVCTAKAAARVVRGFYEED